MQRYEETINKAKKMPIKNLLKIEWIYHFNNQIVALIN